MDILLVIIGWIAWSIVLVLAISNVQLCRSIARKGSSFSWVLAIQVLLWWVIVFLFLFSDLSKLHILWALPVSYFAAMILGLSRIPLVTLTRPQN